MRGYPEGAWERAMKIQEVILRAGVKRITGWQAEEIIGMTDRSLRRGRWRYEQHGDDGLLDRRRGRPSPKRVPLGTVEEVLRLYQKRYHDFNVRHFHEKLREEHGLELSYTWVKLALQGAGLVKKAPKRGVHRKRRFGTWQGRLPQELRLAGMGTVDEANRFLRERCIPEMNRKFSRPAAERADTPLCRCGASTWTGSSRCSTSGGWRRTTRRGGGIGCGSWSGRASAGRWPAVG